MDPVSFSLRLGLRQILTGLALVAVLVTVFRVPVEQVVGHDHGVVVAACDELPGTGCAGTAHDEDATEACEHDGCLCQVFVVPPPWEDVLRVAETPMRWHTPAHPLPEGLSQAPEPPPARGC